jgi:hypothetical protein
MSEYERPERMTREPTVDDIRQLMGASTPHFALQIRNRIRNLIWGLPGDHPARVVGEREIARLEEIAFGGEARGPVQGNERPLPSVRLADEKGAPVEPPSPGSEASA